MLASSPSTITETELALEHPEPTDPGQTFRRPRSQRLGFGAWLAIAWIVVVIVCRDLRPDVPAPISTDNLVAGKRARASSRSPATRSASTGTATTCSCCWPRARGARMLVSVGAIALRLAGRRHARPDRGLLQAGVDSVLTTFFNVLLAIPQFVLALSLVTVFATTAIDASGNQHPPSSARRMVVLIFAFGVVTIPILARITRANSLQWSQREFVMAARAQGPPTSATMVREVLPNVLPAMFSIALLGIAVVIVAEGGLSILGVGVLSPAVSWGSMIAARAA